MTAQEAEVIVTHSERQGEHISTPYSSSPTSESPDRSEEVLQSFLEGVSLDMERTLYLSTPVTTGKWFYEELLRLGAQGVAENLPDTLVEPVRAESMRRNLIASVESFEQLKSRVPGYNVINPSTLQASWSQDRFLKFWVRVIYRYVGQLVLAPDWEFSTGATFECAMALDRGISVSTLDGAVISREAATVAVRGAVLGLKRRGLTPSKLEDLIQAFDLLPGAGEQL